MLMDEPLSSLDVARKQEILPHIEKLPGIFGVPVLYVTHNVDEVARLANDVVLLAGGRIVAHGSVAAIFERSDLGAFTGGLEAGVVLRAQVAAHDNGIATLRVGTQQLRVPMAAAHVGTTRPIRIHARDVAIATVRPEKLSIRNVLSARILHDRDRRQHERRAAARRRRRALTCENYPRRPRGARALRRPRGVRAGQERRARELARRVRTST